MRTGLVCIFVLALLVEAAHPTRAEEPGSPTLPRPVVRTPRPGAQPGGGPDASPPVLQPSLSAVAAPIPAPPPPVVRTAVAVRPTPPAGAYARRFDPFQVARGPVEVRDEFLLAQVRLTLPAVAPDPIPRGAWLLGFHWDWGNDFGFSQTGSAEAPYADRRFLVDGERHTLEARVRRGLGGGVDVGLRVPLRWRGGGILDGLIEWWHDTWGLANNSREEFYTDRYRVEGRDANMNRFSWDDEEGWGLGRVELDARWAFLRPSFRKDWRGAVVARVGLPTGTGPYETGGVEAGLQVVAAKQIHRRIDVYGGVGGTVFSNDSVRGIEYETLRGHGFFVLEWRPLSFMSLLVQTDVSTRLITNLVDYPGVQWYLQIGAKFDLGGGWRLTLGNTENLIDQQSTEDFGIWAGLEVLL